MCGCGAPNLPQNDMPESLLTSSGNFDPESVVKVIDPESKQTMVVMEYVGSNQSTFSVNSRVARGIQYRFGNNDSHRRRPVFIGDIDFLLGLNTQGERDFSVVSNIAVPDTQDPAAFLGHPISA